MKLYSIVISGLGDSAGNKAVLFGAKNISDFKDRLKTYEKIRKSSSKGNHHLNKGKDNVGKKSRKARKLKRNSVTIVEERDTSRKIGNIKRKVGDVSSAIISGT